MTARGDAPARATTGLLIGKFLPLHRGHSALIDTARQRCDDLTVVVFARSDEPIALAVRERWLRSRHPDVRIVGVVDDHRVDFTDDAAWAYWAEATRVAYDPGGTRGPPTLVFSSDDYGVELARRLGSEPVIVDPDRTAVPVSGSLVREDPFAAWAFLDPEVRAWFVRRVVVVGAESTGKTTLAAMLATRFSTVWVPEYGRTYSEVRGLIDPWTSAEFVHIAREQTAMEDAAALAANRVLICDTDVLATGIWHERYVDRRRLPALDGLVRPVDLYLLTEPDVPWVDDGLRDGAGEREWMTGRFVEELTRRGAAFVRVGGAWDERDRLAVDAVAAVLARPWSGSSYRPDEPGMIRRV